MTDSPSGAAVGMVAFDELASALGDLGRAEQLVEALGLDPQALVERFAEASDRGLLVGVDRRLRQLGDLGRQLQRPLEAPAARRDLVDEPDPLGLGGADDAAGDDHLHRATHADDPRQALRATVGEADVPAPAGDAEAGVLVGDPDVAPAGPLEPAGVGDAVDGGDHRLVEVGPAGRAEHAGALAAGVGGELLRREGEEAVLARGPGRDVAAGAEGAFAGAGQHRDLGFVVVAERGPGVLQLARGLRRDRIHLVRAVERHDRDRPASLVADVLVVHLASSGLAVRAKHTTSRLR